MNDKILAARNVVTSKVARQILLTQKHSPVIMFAGGALGLVATAVLTAKATLELDAQLEEMKKNIYLVEENIKDEAEQAHALRLVKSKGALNVARLYAPAFTVGVASLALFTGSHVVLTKRNASITAAYVAVDKAFNKYRQRVLAEVGEEKERELRFGVEEREVITEGKNGPEVKTLKTQSCDLDGSMYARFFDNRSANWSPRPEYNLMFLRATQKWCNDKLRAQGHLFLNDVFDNLGLERTREGALVGWVFGQKGGDNEVSFGIFDGENEDRFYDFMTGREGAILLDFNVDGPVYDKI